MFVKRWLVVTGLVWGCGDNVHPPELAMHIVERAPAYGEAPFPTDAVRDGVNLGLVTGLDSIVGAHDDLIAAHLQQLGGWGLRPAIEFFIEGPVDPTTVPAATKQLTDALVVLDVDPNTPEHDVAIPFDWRYDDTRHVITGVPALGISLKDGVKYAAVITKDIKGIDGETLVPGDSIERLMHSPPDRWKTTADVYGQLSTTDSFKNRIVGLTVFTTQQATVNLVGGRESDANTAQVPAAAVAFDDASIIFDTQARLDALLGHAQRDTQGPRTGLEQWGTDNPTGIAHDHVAVVASGTMKVGVFRRPDTGTDGPEDETFEIGAYGVPKLVSVATIPVTFILPKGPVPANGFPTVVFGHGLGGSRHDALNLAEPLCSKGFAVVAIDMWGHGSRYNPTDVLNNAADNKPMFSGDPSLHDGFGDPESAASELDFFENFLNMGAIRDTIRQSALDETRLAMLIQAKPDLTALAGPYGQTPKLDINHVAYLGESFGTIVGTLLASIEPSIDLYVLDVPGGGILDQIVPNSPELATLALPFAQTIYRTQGTLDRFHPAISMMQTILEGGDSLAYAPHVLKNRLTVNDQTLGKRSVVLIQAVLDETMPAASTYALARNLGIAVLKPDLDPPSDFTQVASPATGNVIGQTGILVQYEPATHGYNWSATHGQLKYQPNSQMDDGTWAKLDTPITITEPIYDTQAQVAQILLTHAAGMLPVVQSTKAPVADFDDDGVPDKMDPYPYDPTR